MSETNVCRVCGTAYPLGQASCPRCGALPGTTRPAFLRCRQCGAVFASSCTICPSCRQIVSPQTASVVLLADVPPALRPAAPHPAPATQRLAQPSVPAPATRRATPASSSNRPATDRRHRWIIGSIIAAAFALTVVAESLIVRKVSAAGVYADCMTLWNCGGPISDNRRTPPARQKPAPKPAEEQPSDTLRPVHPEEEQEADVPEADAPATPPNRQESPDRNVQPPVRTEPDPFE